MSIDNVWIEFKTTGNLELRNQLVENYLPLIDRQARRVCKKSSNVDYYDLKQDGVIGLIEAIEAFDPTKGVKFETFSQRRISGSMYDRIRDLDWIPRLVRDRYKLMRSAVTALQHELGRDPKRTEVANRLSISPEMLDKWLRDLPVNMNSFSSYERSDQDTNPIHKLIARETDNPAKIVEGRDFVERACSGMDRTNKLIINMSVQDYRPVDMARAAGMSQTSISQRRCALVELLQNKGISVC